MLQEMVLCPFMKERQRGEEDSSCLFSPVKTETVTQELEGREREVDLTETLYTYIECSYIRAYVHEILKNKF